PGFALAQGAARLPALAADLGLAELPLDRDADAWQGAALDAVARAGLHGADGRLLAELVRDDEKGDVEVPLLQDREGLESSEPLSLVVGERDVEAALRERGPEAVGRIDLSGLGRIAGLPQVLGQQGCALRGSVH